MNRDDGISVVARMMAAWPGQEWSDAMTEMWLEDLDGWTVEEGMAAVAACRRTLQWSPSWSQFYSALCDAKRLRNRSMYRAELTAGPFGREDSGKAIGIIREWYRSSRSREQHWHGGPGVCVVCGGVKPVRTSPRVVPPTHAERETR